MPDERTTCGGATNQVQVLICLLLSERRVHSSGRADMCSHYSPHVKIWVNAAVEIKAVIANANPNSNHSHGLKNRPAYASLLGDIYEVPIKELNRRQNARRAIDPRALLTRTSIETTCTVDNSGVVDTIAT